MAKYQQYAEYKDSGVEWLGEVPSDWDVVKIKHLSSVKRGASPRPIDDPKFFDDYGDYAWVRIADVSASDMYLLNTTQTMSALGSSLSVKLEPNELFLSTTYAYVQAKDDETKKDLTRRPRQSLTLTTGWDDGEYGVSASVVAKSDSKDFPDTATAPQTITPGYVSTNVNVYWQPIPMIKLFANIENIGDVNYKTAYNGNGVYYINGGRQATAGVTFRY